MVQGNEELLQDMSLAIYWSGGNWFNWVFQVINSKEIANLSEVRRAKREASRYIYKRVMMESLISWRPKMKPVREI